MENALLIGLSQQTALKRQMNVIANNLANINTSGFKKGQLLFEEYVMPVARDNNWNGNAARLSYVQDGSILRDYSAGTLKRTGNPLDIAIGSRGWLVVQTPAGERYTRNGQLKLDAEGKIVTISGDPVIGEGGPITIGPDETGITIAKDGTISTSAGTKGRLRIVSFDNEHRLKKTGDSMVSSEDPPKPVEIPRILQGMVEQSNVKPVVEMTRMIEVMRSYIRTSTMLAREDELMRSAINKLGQAPA